MSISRPSSLTASSPQFIFFGGKGGVGKTTCAAARAVSAAIAGDDVLVVSTDPAHSLGDALRVRLSARPGLIRPGPRTWGGPSKVRRPGGSLSAVELDAPRAFARWLADHRQALGEIVEHGTWLDREDVDALLGLSIPGVDELVGMLEIVRLAVPRATSARAGLGPREPARGGGAPRADKKSRAPRAYDKVIIDTAPTGHTLRLLAAPETVGAVAEALDALQEEHRLIREQLARVGRPEASDRLIALLTEQARETGALLRDRRRTTFHWITLPEEMSLAESEDAIGTLEGAGIRVAEIIVNRVIPAGPPCPLCDRRRADERRVVERVKRRLGRGRRLRIIPAEIKEPRGVKALAKVGKFAA